jgi:hypothetical protein
MATNLLNLDISALEIRNSTIKNIQVNFIDAQSSTLKFDKCTIFEIGNHVVYHLEDMKDRSFLEKFKDIMISKA